MTGWHPRAAVPCGTCRRCCTGNSIVMLLAEEGDDVGSYDYEVSDLPIAGRGPVLRRKPNGDCVYLGPDGCTIHDRTPLVCRVFDCRKAYQAFAARPRKDRRLLLRNGLVGQDILDAGKERLPSLEGSDTVAPPTDLANG